MLPTTPIYWLEVFCALQDQADTLAQQEVLVEGRTFGFAYTLVDPVSRKGTLWMWEKASKRGLFLSVRVPLGAENTGQNHVPEDLQLEKLVNRPKRSARNTNHN